MWPVWFNLIGECGPSNVFGEQVASPDGSKWLDGVFADLEGEEYACGAAVLTAAGAGADHIRQRIYFTANALRAGRQGHQPIERVPFTASAAFTESRDATARIRSALAGDYADLLPGDEPTIALERLRAKGYGNAINAQTAAMFIAAADEAISLSA